MSRDRGLSPVVGKTLELGVGVLFVALLTATFFGGVVPEYRAAVSDEIGDRALVAGAERVEAAVPDGSYPSVYRRVAVRLPPAIRGDPYRIVAERDVGSDHDADADPERGSGTERAADTRVAALTLVHPDPDVGGRVRLAVPGDVTVSGSWTSASPSRVVVRGGDGGLSVRLEDGDTSTAAEATVTTTATTVTATTTAAEATVTTTSVDRTPEVAA